MTNLKNLWQCSQNLIASLSRQKLHAWNLTHKKTLDSKNRKKSWKLFHSVPPSYCFNVKRQHKKMMMLSLWIFFQKKFNKKQEKLFFYVTWIKNINPERRVAELFSFLLCFSFFEHNFCNHPKNGRIPQRFWRVFVWSLTGLIYFNDS